MSFLRSLFSGVSGLRNHQVMMDVIGNNISNINTIGFKASRTTFSETFAQMLQSASSPTSDTGGTNPMQVGLGSAVATIDTIFSQGNLETTNSTTDLAIQGDGFFAVNKGGKTYYTRVGSFQFDAQGRLVNPGNGAIVQGKVAGPDGTLPTGTSLSDLKIALDQKSPARATTTASFSGNLDASAAVGKVSLSGNIDSGAAIGATAPPTTVTVTDAFGTAHTVTVTLTKTAANTWSYAIGATNGAITGGAGTLTFDATGKLVSVTPADFTLTPAGGAPPLAFSLDGTLTQIAGANALTSTETDPVNTSCSVTVYDSLGNQHTLSLEFVKTNTPNVWTWTASVGTPATITGGRTGQISFNSADGSLASFTYDDGSSGVAFNPNNGASAMTVSLNPGTAGVFAGVTQSQGSSSVSARSQDGYSAGDLSSISIDQSGKIVGNFSNSTVLGVEYVSQQYQVVFLWRHEFGGDLGS